MRERDIFIEALQVSDSSRTAFVDQACGEDDSLRQKVESLLQLRVDAEGFLENPVSNFTPTPAEAEFEDVGKQIGPYKLLEQIGEGGMGAVYMAEQQQPVQRKVALKIIKPGMDTKDVIARFDAERQALAMMDHPNIAKILDAGTTDNGRPFFVMDLVRGIPITDYCDKHQLTPRERLELFVAVCRAVQHAHLKGIIHRDLKPGNVLVELHDVISVPKVIDFGVAKAMSQKLTEQTLFTNFAQMIGTPLYMSPEQAELSGLDVDTRSDVYSLGVLLYELLSGTTPFDRQTLREAGYDEVRRMIQEDEPPKPSARISTLGAELATVSQQRNIDPYKLGQTVRGELDWIVMRAMEKDRNRRYESASAFSADVERYLNDEAVEACPPSTVYKLQKWLRRHRTIVSSLAGLGLTILTGIVIVASLILRHNERLVDVNARLDSTNEELNTANTSLGDSLTELRASHRRSQEVQYALTIKLAGQQHTTQDPRQLLELLDKARPAPGEYDCRGIEWYYLRGLVEIDHVQQQVSSEGLESVEFSPDGQWLVLANRSGNIVLKNAQTLEVVTEFQMQEGGIRDVSFSPDAKWIAAASVHGAVTVWNRETLEELQSFSHPLGVYQVCFSPDGKLLATAGEGPRIQLWDLQTGAQFAVFEGHLKTIESIAFSANGRYLVSGSNDGTVKLWSLESMKLERSSEVFPSRVTAVAVSDDARTIVAGTVHGRVLLFDEHLASPHVIGRHLDPVTDVEIDMADSRLFSADRGGSIVSWIIDPQSPPQVPTAVHRIPGTGESKRGRRPYTWAAHSTRIRGLALSVSGTQLASVADDGVLSVWPTHVPAKSKQMPVPSNEKAYWDFSLIPGSDRIACVSTDALRVFDLQTLSPVRDDIALRTFMAQSVTVSPDGETIAVGRRAGQLEFYDQALLHRKTVMDFSTNFSPGNIAFSRDGQTMVLRDSKAPDGDELRFYDLETMSRIEYFPKVQGRQVCFSPDGRLLAFGEDDSDDVVVWEMPSGQELLRLSGHTSTVNAVVFSHDGQVLASVSDDRSAILWEADSGKELHELSGHRSGVWSATFSPDGRTLFTGDSTGTLSAWHVASGNHLLDLASQPGELAKLAFSADGSRLIRLHARQAIYIDEITLSE